MLESRYVPPIRYTTMSPVIEPSMPSTTLRAPLNEHGADWEQDVPEPAGEAYKVVCTAAWETAGATAASLAYAASETNPSVESQRSGRDQAPRAFILPPDRTCEISSPDASLLLIGPVAVLALTFRGGAFDCHGVAKNVSPRPCRRCSAPGGLSRSRGMSSGVSLLPARVRSDIS